MYNSSSTNTTEQLKCGMLYEYRVNSLTGSGCSKFRELGDLPIFETSYEFRRDLLQGEFFDLFMNFFNFIPVSRFYRLDEGVGQ